MLNHISRYLVLVFALGCGGSSSTGSGANQIMEFSGNYNHSTVTGEQRLTQAFVATVQLEAPPPDPNGLVVEFDASMFAGNSMAPVKVRVPSAKIENRKDGNDATQVMRFDVNAKDSTLKGTQVGDQSGSTRRIEVLGGSGQGASQSNQKVDQIELPANQIYRTKDEATKACAAPRQVISVGSNGNPPFLCVPKESIVNQ